MILRCSSQPSFVYLETHVKQGSHVTNTVDLVTDIANVILMHDDEKVLQRDVAFIRQLENRNKLFEYYDEPLAMPSKIVPVQLATVLNTKNTTTRRRLTFKEPLEMYWQ